MNLTDIELDLYDARDRAANLRAVIRCAHRRGLAAGCHEATLAITERQIARLTDQRLATLAAIERLCATITIFARQGWPHDREEARLLHLLGCESIDGNRWPYVAAALRAREEPTVESITTFFRARLVLKALTRQAA